MNAIQTKETVYNCFIARGVCCASLETVAVVCLQIASHCIQRNDRNNDERLRTTSMIFEWLPDEWDSEPQGEVTTQLHGLCQLFMKPPPLTNCIIMKFAQP